MNVKTEMVVPGVVRVPTVFVNAYLIDTPQGDWVLVDTGPPNSSRYLHEATEVRYGEKKPEAIILTHGHFDHAISVRFVKLSSTPARIGAAIPEAEPASERMALARA